MTLQTKKKSLALMILNKHCTSCECKLCEHKRRSKKKLFKLMCQSDKYKNFLTFIALKWTDGIMKVFALLCPPVRLIASL